MVHGVCLCSCVYLCLVTTTLLRGTMCPHFSRDVATVRLVRLYGMIN